MKSAIRPTRGRPNKVTKPGSSPARGGRPPQPRHPQAHLHEALAAAAAAASADLDIKPDDEDSVDPTGHSSVFDDSRIGPEDYAAAAAATAIAMETGLTGDTHGEAEADADMEEEDPSNNSGLGHVDLTAVNMAQHAPQDQQQMQQQVDLQQAVQQAHHHQQQQQAHAHQQQPPAQMNHSMDPTIVKTTEDLAHESGYTELNIESTFAKRLAREPGQRHASQRRPEQVLNLARRSNVEALFAHIAGTPARVPCKNCHKGHGPWTACVVVDGQMCGSCANCWFNASGARCSFHDTRNPQVNPNVMPSAAGSVPPDASFRGFPPAHALNPGLGGMYGGGLLTNNPMIQQIVNKAMTEVRQADKANRQLMLIDITAKQLALHMAEYEELINNQDNAGVPGPGQQMMGDDGGA
ncbi:Protein of unknown function (DUF3716) domain containing protein [Rhypophila decipiens]